MDYTRCSVVRILVTYVILLFLTKLKEICYAYSSSPFFIITKRKVAYTKTTFNRSNNKFKIQSLCIHFEIG